MPTAWRSNFDPHLPVEVRQRFVHKFLWSSAIVLLTGEPHSLPYLVVVPPGGPRDGVGRRDNIASPGVVGRGAVDRGDRSPARGVEECRCWQSASAGSARPAFADPTGRSRLRLAAAVGSPTRRGADAAAFVQHIPAASPGRRTERGPSDRRAGGKADTARSRSAAGATPLWPDRHLLLATRRAWHAELPLLRCGFGSRKTLLLRACQAGICPGERSPRGCCLTRS